MKRPLRWQRRRRADMGYIATLLATAKMNQVDPHGWLAPTLERIANG